MKWSGSTSGIVRMYGNVKLFWDGLLWTSSVLATCGPTGIQSRIPSMIPQGRSYMHRVGLNTARHRDDSQAEPSALSNVCCGWLMVQSILVGKQSTKVGECQWDINNGFRRPLAGTRVMVTHRNQIPSIIDMIWTFTILWIYPTQTSDRASYVHGTNGPLQQGALLLIETENGIWGQGNAIR